MRILLLFLVAFAPVSCASNEALLLGNALTLKAAEAIEADHQDLVRASTEDIATLEMENLELRSALRWIEADKGGMIARTAAQEITADALLEQRAILEAKQERRDRLGTAENIELLRQLSEALRKRLSADDAFGARILELLQIAGSLYGQDSTSGANGGDQGREGRSQAPQGNRALDPKARSGLGDRRASAPPDRSDGS
jgi:hypothetical protein